MGEMIELPAAHGGVPAWLATTTRPRPGIVVLSEWWGRNDHIRDVCDRFGDGGLVAIAPDIHRVRTTDGPDEAGRLMLGPEVPRAVADCRAAADFLLGHESVRGDKVGIVGFGMGGELALVAASQHAAIAACVDFYGVIPWEGMAPDYAAMPPVLGIFGAEDESIERDRVTAFEADLVARGVDCTVEIFEGCGHAFFDDTRATYDEDAAADAWDMVLDFFDTHLR
ncbi:MAG: dienelactone hydrolase family protein [Acidimicrobiia bacterium]|nr:dienelactone hydrolase family protein [Acidimicrobiia bacterium]